MILHGLSYIYGGVTSLRNYLYDSEVLEQTKFSTPIISIGNITTGGTGKTPTVDALVKFFESKGKKTAIVSRGYGGVIRDVAKVDAVLEGSAETFGDEPTLLSIKNPNSPVYVGPRRVHVVNELLSKENPDVIFADDAFQHRALARKINIVILDATEELKNYRLLPLGRLRESMPNLARADYLIFSKSNLVDEEQLSKLKSFILKKSGLNSLPPYFTTSYHASGIKNTLGDIKDLKGKSVLLVSGIARPDSFDTLASSAGVNSVGHKIFKDHFKYTQPNIDKVIELAKSKGVGTVLTTDKDLTKLKNFAWPGIELCSLHLSLSLEGPKEELYENTFNHSS